MDRTEGVRMAKTKLGASKFDRLIESAQQVFAEKGFYAASIADICKGASAAIGTFYIYFDDKTAVYRYMLNHYKEQISKAVTAAAANATAAHREKEAIKAYVRYLYLHPDCLKIIWGSLAVSEKLLYNYYSSCALQLEQDLTASELSLPHCDIKTLAYFLLGIANFVALRFLIEKDLTETELDNVTEQVFSLLHVGAQEDNVMCN